MITYALPVFLMMLGAAFLGFLLAWVWSRSLSSESNSVNVGLLESKLSTLQTDYEKVLEYSNNFHKEKKDLVGENEMLAIQLQQIKTEVTQLENDKSILLQEYRNQEDVDTQGRQATDNEEEIQALRVQVTQLNQELVNWKNKHEDLLEQYETINKSLEKHNKNKPAKSGKNKKWESKYKALKLKFLELTHEKNIFEDHMANMKEANDKLLTEIMEIKTNLPEPTIVLEKRKKKEKEKQKDIFHKIKKRANLIDFERIGKSSEKKKDDLKQINGVGPFIEKKLNALGIFKFEQIAKLEDDDLLEIIKIIELPAGIAKLKDRNWIDQAKNML